MSVAESDVELAAIEYLQDLGWQHLDGPTIAPDGPAPERTGFGSVLLEGRLRDALRRINGHLPASILDDVVKQVVRLDSPVIAENNLAFTPCSSTAWGAVRGDGGTRGDQAWLIDFDDPANNDFLVVNQLTIVQGSNNRRPDLVLYVNGLPIGVIELKNPTDDDATIHGAWNQLQFYKQQIPVLFHTNEILVVSDGIGTKVGSLTAGFDRFGPWRTIDGNGDAPSAMPRLEVLIRSLFEKRRLLDYLQNFVICEMDGDTYIKKIAGYHQFFAVNKAVEQTMRASGSGGDKRRRDVPRHWVGQVASMSLYAGKIVKHPAMENPTLVVVTDRNDLDGQFSHLCGAEALLRRPPSGRRPRNLRTLRGGFGRRGLHHHPEVQHDRGRAGCRHRLPGAHRAAERGGHRR